MTSLTARRPRIHVPAVKGLSGRWGDVAGVLVAVLVVGGPALFTHDGFGVDFTNHMWLVWVQEAAISHHLAPTYFINANPLGVFVPFFMFYGGTLYALTGGLAALSGGHVTDAFVAVTCLAIAAAYSGPLWLARQLGVRSWLAHAPAITYVASAYYVTNLYGRGAWPEAVATSMLPLVFAAGWSLARADAIGLGPAVLFVVSVAVLFGSHNITVMLGTLSMVGGLSLLRLALGSRFKPVGGARRLLAIAALLILGVAIDAWYLLPDILHASSTQVGAEGRVPAGVTGYFDRFHVLFDPLRSVPAPSSTPALYVQAPDWFLAWVIAVAATLGARLHSRLRRAGAALLVGMAIVLALLMINPVWNATPAIFQSVQFPFRLNTYLVLVAVGLVLVGVLGVNELRSGRRRSVLVVALAGATAVSVALCVWQLWVPTTHIEAPTLHSYANRDGIYVSTHVLPRSWYAINDYADASQPVVPVDRGLLNISPYNVNSDHVRLRVDPPPGPLPFYTDITGGPYAVRVGGGLARVGRTQTSQVAARRVTGGSGPVTLTLGPAGGAVTVGQVVSLLALAVSILLLVVYPLRRRGRRSSRGPWPPRSGSAAPVQSPVARDDAAQRVDV